MYVVYVICMSLYVVKRDVDDDSDGAHLTSFGTVLQAEEEAKEYEKSPYSVQVH